MDFDTILKKGLEVIPPYLHAEWNNFIEVQRNNTEDKSSVQEICMTVVEYLKEMRTLKNGRTVANRLYEEYPHKSNYSKNLVNLIAEFAKHPENINFLQGYYESFLDISNDEEIALSERIKELKMRNEIVLLGVNYESFKDIGKKGKINIDINGDSVPLIESHDEIYYGINDKEKLVVNTSLNEFYDLVYIIGNEDEYTRIISRQNRLIVSGMITDKTVINSNNGIMIENFAILKNPNFFDIRQTVEYTIRIKNKLKNIDSKLIESIIEQIKITKTNFKNDSTFGDNLFNEIARPNEKQTFPKQQ